MSIYYLTKHCLTDGIVEANTRTREMAGAFRSEPRTRLDISRTCVKHFRKPENWLCDSHPIGKEAFERREDAVADAVKRRDRKLASLRKQIAKLEALTFE